MAVVILAGAVLALAASAPRGAGATVAWQPFVEEASRRFGVPSAWIAEVIRAESNGRTMLGGRPIRSRVGAIGLMQLMPATWAAMRGALGLGGDPDDPHDNILAGTFYLRLMYERFGYPGLFAAYNAGPARYAAHLATGRALPAETIAYLRKVEDRGIVVGTAAGPVRATVFALDKRTAEASPSSEPERGPAVLFAVRKDDR